MFSKMFSKLLNTIFDWYQYLFIDINILKLMIKYPTKSDFIDFIFYVFQILGSLFYVWKTWEFKKMCH